MREDSSSESNTSLVYQFLDCPLQMLVSCFEVVIHYHQVEVSRLRSCKASKCHGRNNGGKIQILHDLLPSSNSRSATWSRLCTDSSVSVPLPRSLFSSSPRLGGFTKMYRGFKEVDFNCITPWMSMSKRQIFPFSCTSWMALLLQDQKPLNHS